MNKLRSLADNLPHTADTMSELEEAYQSLCEQTSSSLETLNGRFAEHEKLSDCLAAQEQRINHLQEAIQAVSSEKADTEDINTKLQVSEAAYDHPIQSTFYVWDWLWSCRK